MRMIQGRQLPPIGWVGRDALSVAKFEPPTQVDMAILGGDGTKPGRGGLWCSPVVKRRALSKPLGTLWSLRNGSAEYTPVVPLPDAKVVLIANRPELIEVINRWPDNRPEPWPHSELLQQYARREPRRVDWQAMSQEVDAVFLTPSGVARLNLMEYNQVHLWGWDVPTVLLLTPAFEAATDRVEVQM